VTRSTHRLGEEDRDQPRELQPGIKSVMVNAPAAMAASA
jgi:hypothetical protein